ncbi:hypothetical protein PFISCL1PPCAC_6594, partial [Pristionchus fissidentatus]
FLLQFQMLLLFFLHSSSWIAFLSAEPPNLLRVGLQKQMEIERAMKNYLPEWERAIVDDDGLFSGRKILDSLVQNSAVVSKECSEDVKLIVKSLLEFEAGAVKGNITLTNFDRKVLLPMLDSSGRIGPAILRGHILFAGHFSECINIDYVVEGRERHYNGAYFKVSHDVAFRDNSVNGSCEGLNFKYGVCLPAGCSSADLNVVFKPETGDALVVNSVCDIQRTNDNVPELDVGFYVSVTIFGIIIVIGILAGIVDYFFADFAEKAGVTKSLGWRLFMAFSLYTNISSIFDVQNTHKDGQIGPIHCIRFFSMSWVVLGHFFSTYMIVAANPLDIFLMGRDFLSEFIMNAYFAVDSFFFMSGVLLTFIWFKNYHKNPSGTNSLVSWIMFYIHRIIRLSPAYYMAVIFYTWILKQLFIDKPLNMNIMYTQDYCRETWWIELLY